MIRLSTRTPCSAQLPRTARLCGHRAHVEQVLVVGGRVRGVALRGGQTVEADWVVNCAGRWADTLAVVDLPRLRLPLAPTLGLLVFTPPVASGLRRVVHSPSINMRPDGAGRLMLHADDIDEALAAETEPGVGSPLVQEMLRRAAVVLPGMGQVAAEAVRIGIRAIPADGLSAVGAMPGSGRLLRGRHPQRSDALTVSRPSRCRRNRQRLARGATRTVQAGTAPGSRRTRLGRRDTIRIPAFAIALCVALAILELGSTRFRRWARCGCRSTSC